MTFRTHRGIRPAIALLLSLWQAGSLQAAQINGVIRDGESGEPLGFAQVLIVGLERGVVAHSDGTFHILRLPEGDLTLRVSRIGYHDHSRSVTLAARDTITLEFALLPDHLKIPEVISEAKRPGAQQTLSTTLSGRTLQEKLGATIAEPLESTVGIAVRTMGPAPARPVSRGMGGARLTILEDGRPTGDLSASSSDHAVAIDPLLAQSVTIVRGPSAYHYGSSVMGGVVNILRNLTQEAEPHRLSGRALMHGSSVSSSAGSSVALTIPLKKVSAHGDMSLKRSGDVCTPYGALENTQSELVSGSFGLRLVDQWGNADAVFSRFATTYGLPGGFLGAHPNGVSLKLLREVGSSSIAWRVNRAACKELSAAYSFTRVHQQEFEAGGSLGVEFGLLEDHLNLDAKFGSRFGLKEIRLSADATLRDYETAAFSFTPDSRQHEGGVALSAERTVAAWSLSGAVRGDVTRIEPDFADTSRVIGIIQARGFSGLSGAVRADRVLSNLWSVGCQLSRSFRAPQIEELFSEGPHLAAYSYEIGNTSLPAEFGWGLEADLVRKSDDLNLRFGAYANRFASYIFPQATGRPSPVRNDLELYEYAARDAAIMGIETECSATLSPADKVKVQVSSVHGSILGGDHLPAMPPFTFTLEHVRDFRKWRVTSTLRGSAEQRELGEFESRTAGYLRADLGVSRYWSIDKALLVLTGSVGNIFDTPYRNHLSRVRSIMPEAGRDFSASLSLQI